MEEDVLGPREEVVGDRYTRCTRCGRVFPRALARLEEAELIDETRSEQLELCDECQRATEDRATVTPG